jgi:hypothetical protein
LQEKIDRPAVNSAAPGDESYHAIFGYSGRNSLVVNTGLRASFNAHWNATANFHGTLAQKAKNYAGSLALGYNF